MINFIKQSLNIGAIVLSIVLVYTTIRSGIAYKQGEGFYSQGNYAEAIEAYSESIRWYHPLNFWSRKSVSKISNIAIEMENNNALRLSMQAHEELRAALSSIRGFYVPMRNSFEKSTDRYVDLLKNKISMLPTSNTSSSSLKDMHSHQYSGLKRALLSLAFLAWLLSLVVCIKRAFNSEGQLLMNKTTLKWGALSLSLMGGWLCLLTLI